MNSYDTIIIGSGPAGEAAAILLAKNNKKILMVEKYREVGGGCVHWGTIPSKAIRQTIVSYINLNKTPYLGSAIDLKIPPYPDLLKMTRMVINKQLRMREKHYSKNHVNVVQGHASFIDNKTIEIKNPKKETIICKANNFIIATGSRPFHPEGVDFNHPRIIDSDKILELQETPDSLLIYGSGIIGVEYACMFKKMGVKLNLINSRERVLDFLDQEITDALNYQMRELGIVIRNQEEFKALEEKDNKLIMHFTSGKQIKTEYILWAQGRTGNSDGLNLEAIEIEVDSRKNIKVDENYRTKQKNIYAIGDVVGWPSLASTAFDQGRYVGSLLINRPIEKSDFKLFPTGIYTIPEISSIGYNEAELTRDKIPYEVGIANYRNLAKAQILGDYTGILKILFHRETLEVLGIHCFGRQASEIIHIGQVIMKQKGKANTIKYFVNTTFNYPTMAEAYRTAALNGLNRL